MTKTDILDLVQRIDALLATAMPLRGKHASVSRAEYEPMDGTGTSSGSVVADGFGVYATLRIESLGRSSCGSLFLFDEREIHDPRIEAFVRGWIEALTKVAAAPRRATRDQFSVSAADVRMPIAVVEVADSSAYCREFLKRLWLGRFLPDTERTPMATVFEPAPTQAVVRAGQIDQCAISRWVQSHVQLTFENEDADRRAIDALPPEVRTLFFATNFDAQAGGCGLEGFLSQQPEHVIGGTSAAFEAIGANGLHELIRQVFEEGVDARELDGHGPGQTWYLVEHELRTQVASFVEHHRSQFVR